MKTRTYFKTISILSLCFLFWGIALAAETSTGHITATEGPQIENVEAIGSRYIRIIFNEGVLLPDANPEVTFSISPYNNSSSFLDIEKAEYEISDIELKTIILTTEEQEIDQNYIVTAGINLTNLAGDPVVSGVYDTGFFTGTDKILTDEEITALTQEVIEETPEEIDETSPEITEEENNDITPPEEISNLNITQKLLELNSYLVTLTWTKSIDSAGDLIDQIIYKSLNRGQDYDKGISLGTDATKYETTLEGGQTYTFKITTKDRAGNESTGVIKSIRLPDTGPAGLMLFTSLISGLGASQILRRKRK